MLLGATAGSVPVPSSLLDVAALVLETIED
jgi:hypothetical protein